MVTAIGSQLPGWSQAVRNGGLMLTPREGPECGAIRCEERVRPLLPVKALIARAQAGDPRFSILAQREPELLTTYEGEYAALIVIDGMLAGLNTPAQRSIGYVFGEDFYARIAGLALRADQFARFEETVRRLVRMSCHFLGLRRRRFLFTPPLGYYGVERTFLHAYYYPEGYPRDYAVLCVYPAIPLSMWSDVDLPRHLRPIQGLVVEEISGPLPKSTATLDGQVWELRGLNEARQPVQRSIVVLQDERYVYPLSLDVLETRQFEHQARFLEVVESVQRLPSPTSAPPNKSDLQIFHHWI